MTTKCDIVVWALLAFIITTVSADPSSFDCKMRTLAVEFAQHIQPFRSPEVFADIADALNGAPEKAQGCVISTPRAPDSPNKEISRFLQKPKISSRGIIVYVDPVNGNDKLGNGSLSNPFKSLQPAVDATRASPGGYDSIILRAGTLYDSPTIVLTPEDEGLTVQAYPGEVAWVSGGKLLEGLNWKPYNITKKTWLVVNNYNCVYGNVPNTVFVNKTNTWQDCEALCKANYTSGGLCKVWTWHDKNTGTYALDCYFRTDGLWQPVEQADHVSGHLGGEMNIWMASLVDQDISSVPGMRFNGKRLIRARYPNANPETDGFLAPAVFRANWTPQQAPRKPDIQIDLPASVLSRNTSVSAFQTFTAGVGGTCDRFQPNAGYWCSNHVQGGGSVIYFVPIAMQAGQDILPHSPYAHPEGAIIQTWRPGHWASWMFEVTSSNLFNGSFTNFTLYGGFQGSRGENQGEDTYIENVFEELDAPSEFFYDTNTKILYLFYNDTVGTAPPADGLVVTSTKHLFNITGTQENPVRDISITGIGLRDTAYTYMDPHGIPSGGDWTLERSAVVFLEGTERVTISGCVFERVDGNAILLSSYNRNASIVYNEFAWIGATAVAFWGNTDGGDNNLPPGYGFDGSAGNQPRHNRVAYNLCHELGIWEKQSSCYTQFKSSENEIVGNIFYNGPRAHVNFNDGFRGGARLVNNLIFNSCRESGDHGPFNSWDRDPYLVDFPGTGKITASKAMDEIAYNFILANYNSLGAVDNDDGSSYYNTHDNFFVYGGGGLKNDFEGHDNWWIDNIVVLNGGAALHNGYGGTVGTPGKAPYILDGHVQKLIGNLLAIFNSPNKEWVYSRPICSGTGQTIQANNTIFTSDSTKISVCDMSLAKWMMQGNDPGTTAYNSPADLDDILIGLGHALLWTPPAQRVVAKLY